MESSEREALMRTLASRLEFSVQKAEDRFTLLRTVDVVPPVCAEPHAQPVRGTYLEIARSRIGQQPSSVELMDEGATDCGLSEGPSSQEVEDRSVWRSASPRILVRLKVLCSGRCFRTSVRRYVVIWIRTTEKLCPNFDIRPDAGLPPSLCPIVMAF